MPSAGREKTNLGLMDIEGRVTVYLGGWRVRDSIVLKPAQEFHMKGRQFTVTALDFTAFARKQLDQISQFHFVGWNFTEIMTFVKYWYGIADYSFGKDIDTVHTFTSHIDRMREDLPLDPLIQELRNGSIFIKREGEKLIVTRI
jgi:hypothetical protein